MSRHELLMPVFLNIFPWQDGIPVYFLWGVNIYILVLMLFSFSRTSNQKVMVFNA